MEQCERIPTNPTDTRPSLTTTISVIVPVLNEVSNLPATLDRLVGVPGVEIWVVDGGSQDNTLEIARQYGVHVRSSVPGRAYQMNAGAQSAIGEILLFLHGDTRLPTGFEHWIQETLAQPGVVAGAFALKIDGSGWKLRLVEWGVSQRSRWLHLPYGDQALFLTANLFWEMGGFQPLPIMEDFELVQRLNRRGRVAIVPVPVLTSSRRWQQLGVWRTTLLNQLIILGYFLGVPCDRLAHWYRQQKKCG